MGTRQSVIKGAVPLELWPSVLDVEFEDEQREQFRAQVEAMRLYFSWVPVTQIEAQTGVHQTWLPKLARRCLEIAPDGRIQGFRACIPFSRTKDYCRVSKLPHNPPGVPSGMAGALGVVLRRFPAIEQQLIPERLVDAERHQASLEDKHRQARDALDHFRTASKEQRDQKGRRHEHQIQSLQAQVREVQQSTAHKQEQLTQLNKEAAGPRRRVGGSEAGSIQREGIRSKPRPQTGAVACG